MKEENIDPAAVVARTQERARAHTRGPGSTRRGETRRELFGARTAPPKGDEVFLWGRVFMPEHSAGSHARFSRILPSIGGFLLDTKGKGVFFPPTRWRNGNREVTERARVWRNGGEILSLPLRRKDSTFVVSIRINQSLLPRIPSSRIYLTQYLASLQLFAGAICPPPSRRRAKNKGSSRAISFAILPPVSIRGCGDAGQEEGWWNFAWTRLSRKSLERGLNKSFTVEESATMGETGEGK